MSTQAFAQGGLKGAGTYALKPAQAGEGSRGKASRITKGQGRFSAQGSPMNQW
jgi:hypothetical protein